jgi:uncharacterized protein YndB with AHSA1/START domain
MDDRIEREITINAPLDRVWELVTEPGWWVPSDVPQSADRHPGAVTMRKSEECGAYPVEVIDITPQAYAAFRWASLFPGDDLRDGRTTLVEFHVQPLDSAVRVTVVESGFATLDAPEQARQEGLTGNTGGWEEELASLRTRSESPGQA